MAMSLVLLPLFLALLSSLPLSTLCQPSDASYQLAWSEEFDYADGAQPSSSTWSWDIGGGGWGNGELQYYTNRTVNSHVNDSQLLVQAAYESYGGSAYTSARLHTEGKLHVYQGYIAARIAIAMQNGFWPAFWAMGAQLPTLGWPYCGEVDIMEQVNGDSAGSNPNDHTQYGTAHWNANGINSTEPYTHVQEGGTIATSPNTWGSAWHVYAVEWTSSSLAFSVDGAVYATVCTTCSIGTNSFTDASNPMFILVNVALGGQFPNLAPAASSLPAQLQVDWIRVWQKQDGVSYVSRPSATTPANVTPVNIGTSVGSPASAPQPSTTSPSPSTSQLSSYVQLSDQYGHSFTWTASTAASSFPILQVPPGSAVSLTISASADVAFASMHVTVPGESTNGQPTWNYAVTLNATNTLPTGRDGVTAAQLVAGTTVFFTVGWQSGQRAADSPAFFRFTTAPSSASSPAFVVPHSSSAAAASTSVSSSLSPSSFNSPSSSLHSSSLTSTPPTSPTALPQSSAVSSPAASPAAGLPPSYVSVSGPYGQVVTWTVATAASAFLILSVPAASLASLLVTASADVSFCSMHVIVPGQSANSQPTWNYAVTLNATNTLPTGRDGVTASQLVNGTSVFFTVGWQGGQRAVDSPAFVLFTTLPISTSPAPVSTRSSTAAVASSSISSSKTPSSSNSPSSSLQSSSLSSSVVSSSAASAVALPASYVSLSDQYGYAFTWTGTSSSFATLQVPAATALQLLISASADVAFCSMHVTVPGQSLGGQPTWNYAVTLNATNTLPTGRDGVTASQLVNGTTVFFTVGWQSGQRATDSPAFLHFVA